MADKYKKLYVAKTDASKGLESVVDLKNWTCLGRKAFSKDTEQTQVAHPRKRTASATS
jgi:hypothetical protein